jgi:adenylosuccinate lyase
MNTNDIYQSPLVTRYASAEMSHLFSPQFKFSTWRKLWVALAEAEAELGLPITLDQIHEMRLHIEDINFISANHYEEQINHDVMAHIHAYGDQCPLARPIIHWGATSCYVTDNTDLIQMREGLTFLIQQLEKVIRQLAAFAQKYSNQACLGYTHFQPAQLTTLGKRACLWIQDLVLDLQELRYRKAHLRFLGAKGATGTQASFLALFHGDHEKVKQLDQKIAAKMGFDNLFVISGQTYTRKQDIFVLQALAGVGASAHKMATDLRLLAHLKEVEEPFSAKQVGSSAMPYKRNPILSERICGLARFLMALSENPLYTASTQWLERSLDDSSNRRMSIPEAFLCCDAVLETLQHLTGHLVVYPGVIDRHIQEELPFIATENILMAGVRKGMDRQSLHEKIRNHSQGASYRVKVQGDHNDLLERIADDWTIPLSKEELEDILNVHAFTGRAEEQVREFLNQEVFPNILSS